MKHNFKHSNPTIGLELELQIINPKTQDLSERSKEFIRYIQTGTYKDLIKPEITQSMIELNSSVHFKVTALEKEMHLIANYLKHVAENFGVVICGGGTHPFQDWSVRKIFPSFRFKDVAKKYGYLAKRFTIFSMHVHVGCDSPDKAVMLTHHLSRYVPQLIALSASSPFYNGVNTGFDSTRVNVVNAFPMSGHMPNVKNWSEFMAYYHKMKSLDIIKSMKDFYWDVRPKPEFGTVEVRVCDMPLTLSKAAALSAYIQTLAHFILKNEIPDICNDFYQTYHYNRFQAARYGFHGSFINPFTFEKTTIQKDILSTVRLLRGTAKELGNYLYLREIKSMAVQKLNDASMLKSKFTDEESFHFSVQEKCRAWKHSLKIS